MRETSLKTKDLNIGYLKGKQPEYCVMQSINLELYPGEVTSLLGLNGTGKSTLLRTLAGFQRVLSGSIFVQNKPLSRYTKKELSIIIGVVLTDHTAIGGITVYELVALGRHPYTDFFGRLNSNDHKIIEESLNQVGIIHKKDNYVAELSDGERQKAMIAKVLAQQCPIILLDEPTSFLDITSRIEIMVLLRELAKRHKKSILLSTHDLEHAITLSDRLWILGHDGKTISGVPEDLIFDGTIKNIFSKKNVIFNAQTGNFELIRDYQPIELVGAQERVKWLEQALNRTGFSAIAANKNTFPKIECTFKDFKFQSTTNAPIEYFNQVDQLLQRLKEFVASSPPSHIK